MSWYALEAFERRLALTIAKDKDDGTGRTVREFVAGFRGFSSTVRQSEILEEVGMARAPLTVFDAGCRLDSEAVARLHRAMLRADVRPVGPKQLGTIGAASLKSRFSEFDAFVPDSFRYERMEGLTNQGLPFVLEIAFGWFDDDDVPCQVNAGVNWSPALNSFLFEELAGVLGQQMIHNDSPVICLVHLATPAVTYLDSGKTAIKLPVHYDTFRGAIEKVTEPWAKQARREIKDARAMVRRREVLTRQQERDGKLTLKQACELVLPDAYARASGDGRYPANARQVYYAARQRLHDLAGNERILTDQHYFATRLLPDYLATHKPGWDVVFDDRGSLREPHTDREVGMGTVAVREYLAEINESGDPGLLPQVFVQPGFETIGPRHRFGAILYIEKEGFGPLMVEAQIAERFDAAIMSCKGLSVTAARKLADELAGRYDVPLCVLHDCDVTGFTIKGTLENDTRRYQFTHTVTVHDLGLRLADVQRLDREGGVDPDGRPLAPLGRETVAVDDVQARRDTLAKYGATEAEIEFLLEQKQRVELNALTAPQFVELVERKLAEIGIAKVVPDAATLALAARRQLAAEAIEAEVRRFVAKLGNGSGFAVPADLEERVRAVLADRSELPWDAAVAEVLHRERKI